MGLYIHIPFCMKKCNYCDFLSFVGVSQEQRDAYFQTLLQEIDYFSIVYGNKYYVDTLFIGGGTPSFLDASYISKLMDAVRARFEIDKYAEISIETNPRTVTKDKLKEYLDSGINRLSMGAQSCDDELLRYLGRVHTADDFIRNYELARECGFNNINVDLIFGIPGQTLTVWKNTLNKIIGLTPEHISFYSLQLEEGTQFYSMLEKGTLTETDENLDRSMYNYARKALTESGYIHYEISNAAKNGYQCRHNLKYWSMEDYLGLGLGAHSFIEGTRFCNVTDLEQYVNTGKDYKKKYKYEHEKISCDSISPFSFWQHNNTKEDNITDYIITGMRKTEGILFDDFNNRFGIGFKHLYGDVLRKYQNQGLIEVSTDRVSFTEKGFNITNIFLAEFV